MKVKCKYFFRSIVAFAPRYSNMRIRKGFAILVPTQVNFTKQNGLKIGSWMECRKNMIEHTHFKKKKVEKILITLFLRELEASKVLVIVHNPGRSAMPC